MSPKSGNSKIKRQAKNAAKSGEKYTQALRNQSGNTPVTVTSNGATEYELLFVLVSSNIREDIQGAFETAISDEIGFGRNAPCDTQVSRESDGIRLIIPVSPNTAVDEDTLDGILQNVIQDTVPEGDVATEERPEILSSMIGEDWMGAPSSLSSDSPNRWSLLRIAEELEFCTPFLKNEDTDTWAVKVDYYHDGESDLIEYLTNKYKVSVEIVNLKSPYSDGSTIEVTGTHRPMIDFLADYCLGSDESSKESFRSISRDDLLLISRASEYWE